VSKSCVHIDEDKPIVKGGRKEKQHLLFRLKIPNLIKEIKIKILWSNLDPLMLEKIYIQ
jgi:hypothetical protein